ncbi:MAG: TIM44-like domain-containing protein [Deltaproteobacteria bacterium]|nr:TIM44-like domain-containing protein [Deltaproteobacteria bacterium]
MSALPRLVRRALPFGLAIGLWGLPIAQALARVGGGQDWGGGGGGGGGGGSIGSFGGGGGGEGDIFFFLIWLILRHPTIGVPVAIVVLVLLFLSRGRMRVGVGRRGSTRRATWQPGPYPPDPVPPFPSIDAPPSRPRPPLEEIRLSDPNFSLPAFLDFAQVVYARVQQARPHPDLGAVAAYVSPETRRVLAERSRGVTQVRDVIFGTTRVSSGRRAGTFLVLDVVFEANLTEVRAGSPDRTEQVLVSETWTFRKSADALSPAPDRLVALACPSCGNPTETRPDGSCVHCDAPLDRGRALWEVVEMNVLSREPVTPPRLAPGGIEQGADLPTRTDPAFPALMRAFVGRHPDFDRAVFLKRVSEIFLILQQAWDQDRWEDARPWETDPLFQTHRYWMDRYRRFGLRNRLADIQVLDVVLVKVDSDAFYESLTVRLKARMRDWTEDRSGRVVSGDPERPRTFSEYWTFIRAWGTGAAPRARPDTCPSCGAPLDRVSQTGVCGYCNAKITGGAFDWVLSMIEQDDVYAG